MVLYWCDIWSVTLREEHRLRAFENGVLRRVLSRVSVTKDGLVIGFINYLQVVIAINYYTIATLLNLQTLYTNLFGRVARFCKIKKGVTSRCLFITTFFTTNRL
jgi:hypothetical protein